MPRVFFHVYDDFVALDEEEHELPTVEDAREWAITAARELAANEVKDGHLGLTHCIEVVDEHGGEVATIRFKDAVNLHP